MNCLIEVNRGASQYVRQGWANVLQSIGWNVRLCNIEEENINDAFARSGEVNLFLGTTYNLSQSHIKQIQNRPEMKVALYCSGYGDLYKDIDLKEYPIQVVTDNEKKMVGQIKDRISCCHIHIQDNLVKPYIGDWKEEFGIPTIGIMNAADLFVYGKGKFDEKYKGDLSLVGGLWPYKGRNLNKTIVKLCREEWKNYNIKIYGAGWDIPQCLGNLAYGEDAHVFASAKICPNVSEPHSTDNTGILDIVERVFKVPVAGGFLISDNVDLRDTGLHTYVPQFSSYQQFKDLIDYYLKYENIRESLAFRQKEIVWKSHSYFERMSKLLNSIGMTKEAETILEKKTQLFPFPN